MNVYTRLPQNSSDEVIRAQASVVLEQLQQFDFPLSPFHLFSI